MRRGDRVSLASDPMTGALVVKILGHDTVRVFWRRHSTHAGRVHCGTRARLRGAGAHLAGPVGASVPHVSLPALRATDAHVPNAWARPLGRSRVETLPRGGRAQLVWASQGDCLTIRRV
jgi:hypothetical protein